MEESIIAQPHAVKLGGILPVEFFQRLSSHRLEELVDDVPLLLVFSLASELESAFSCRISECLDTTMEPVSVSIEHDSHTQQAPV